MTKMKKEMPTKEQVLLALKSHDTIAQAIKALGIKQPEMMKLLRQYGIAVNSNKKKTPDYEKMYNKVKQERDNAYEWLKENTIEISALKKQCHVYKESRDYFRKRLTAQQNATEWLLKRTPWIVRHFYHKNWDKATAPWASKTLMELNDKVKEERHDKR